jgi:hypothetical protein
MNRIHMYNLDPTKKLKDLNTVQQIIKNNKYATTAATKRRKTNTTKKHKIQNGPDLHT